MRDLLEMSAIDHVYYRSYDPMVRCVGREYTPLRAAQLAMLVAGGRVKWTPDVANAMYWSLNSWIDRVWNRDNASDFFDQDEGLWDRPARADAVDAGAAPKFVKEIEENVKKFGNIYGVQDDAAPVGKAEVLYIVDDSTRAKNPEIAEAMKKLLTDKKVKFAVLAKGTDGWGLYDLGLWALAEEKAKQFAGYIKESGAKTVVANCPAVVYSLREWYPTLGIQLGVEVLHHTEYLEKLGVTGKFKGKVTFHDSSYLGRYLGVLEAPRNLLKKVKGLELVECFFTGEKANPTGPLYAYLEQDWADMIAARRAEELALAAPVVITAAPSSKRNLGAVAKEKGIKVLDIAELLAG
jgi:Fe-S oxidoreductase